MSSRPSPPIEEKNRNVTACKYCGKELPPGRRDRQYCSDAHKQAHYRERQVRGQAEKRDLLLVEKEQRIAELEDYNTRLKNLLKIKQEEVDELEKQVMRLSDQLNVEQRYYDNRPRNFRGWLRKQPRTDLIARLLARDTFPLKGSRAMYEMQVRVLQGPGSDAQEFADLWHLFLLQNP